MATWTILCSEESALVPVISFQQRKGGKGLGVGRGLSFQFFEGKVKKRPSSLLPTLPSHVITPTVGEAGKCGL